MKKILYAIHIATTFFYCRFFAAYVGQDIPLYVFSVLITLPLLLSYKFISKEFLSHFLSIQSLTVWGCYFLLDQKYQFVTERLNTLKGLLLGFLVCLEILAIVHILKRYHLARSTHRKFACESFAFAISPYPLIPELQKLFVVEFNIWRALLVRMRFLGDRDGRSMRQVSTINPGYKAAHIWLFVLALLALNALCLWLIGGWWLAIPLVATIYVSLLVNGETLSFKHHGIYDDGMALKIPNGLYGFVSVDKANIDGILYGAQTKDSDLSVSRFIDGNILLRLIKPISVFGKPVMTLDLCANDAVNFEKECQLETATT